MNIFELNKLPKDILIKLICLISEQTKIPLQKEIYKLQKQLELYQHPSVPGAIYKCCDPDCLEYILFVNQEDVSKVAFKYCDNCGVNVCENHADKYLRYTHKIYSFKCFECNPELF